MAALHRVCVDNTLFLPSFPISDMSDSEIEKAAMGPRRWIELCSRFQEDRHNDDCVVLCPRATRVIDDSFSTEHFGTGLFIVPGGRYLVGYTDDSISVLDLGYTSSADCKIIASVELEVKYPDHNICFLVQTTPDGMGLAIFHAAE